MLRVGLQCVTVVFSSHTHLLFKVELAQQNRAFTIKLYRILMSMRSNNISKTLDVGQRFQKKETKYL